MHPEIPPGPHEHLGYTLNFWQYVTAIDTEADPAAIGKTLHRCHELLRSFTGELPQLAILTESLALLETLEHRGLFRASTLRLLEKHIISSIDVLGTFPLQPLHGDAHPGNLINTTLGLLWTDWEDTFLGPVEWDLASMTWNSRILDENHETADQILESYRQAGGHIDPTALHHSLIARAAVISAWYPVLYPDPSPERRIKLQRRLDWLDSTGLQVKLDHIAEIG